MRSCMLAMVVLFAVPCIASGATKGAVSLPSDMPALNRYEYVILSFGKKMTSAEARTFAGAQKIELRVCDTEYSLDDEQRAALRDLVKDAQMGSSTGC